MPVVFSTNTQEKSDNINSLRVETHHPSLHLLTPSSTIWHSGEPVEIKSGEVLVELRYLPTAEQRSYTSVCSLRSQDPAPKPSNFTWSNMVWFIFKMGRLILGHFRIWSCVSVNCLSFLKLPPNVNKLQQKSVQDKIWIKSEPQLTKPPPTACM